MAAAPELTYGQGVTTAMGSVPNRSASVPPRRAPERTERMSEGIIKRLTDRGFGFIQTEQGSDLFFHMSQVEGTRFDELREGQRVSYVVGSSPKGPCAENVRAL